MEQQSQHAGTGWAEGARLSRSRRNLDSKQGQSPASKGNKPCGTARKRGNQDRKVAGSTKTRMGLLWKTGGEVIR